MTSRGKRIVSRIAGKGPERLAPHRPEVAMGPIDVPIYQQICLVRSAGTQLQSRRVVSAGLGGVEKGIEEMPPAIDGEALALGAWHRMGTGGAAGWVLPTALSALNQQLYWHGRLRS